MDLNFDDIDLTGIFGETSTDAPAEETTADTDVAPNGETADELDAAGTEDNDDEDESTDDETDEGDNDSPGVLDVTPDSTIRLPDGRELSAAELEKGLLLQADYTRKRQADAARVKAAEEKATQFESMFAQLADDPAGQGVEIAVATGDPTGFAMHLVVELAARHQLHPAVAERLLDAFELDENALPHLAKSNAFDRQQTAAARANARNAEAARNAELTSAQQAEVDALTTQLATELDRLAANHSLSDAEKLAVVELADKKGLTDLDDAYALWAHANRTAKPAADPKAKAEKAKQLLDKKRKAAAVTTTASARGTTGPSAADSLDDVLTRNIARLLG